MVVEMESEGKKVEGLLLRLAELERGVGQKQMALEDRTPMEIFTINKSQIVDSAGQLGLFDDLPFN